MSFLEEYLSETKDLTDGNKFFVYSHKINNIYTCNLCGIEDIGNEGALILHNSSILHTELSKLEIVPYKHWMQDCIVDCTGANWFVNF